MSGTGGDHPHFGQGIHADASVVDVPVPGTLTASPGRTHAPVDRLDGSYTEPGAALLDEARNQMAHARWRQATSTLVAARKLRPSDTTVDELLAVAATFAGNKTKSERTVARLRSIEQPSASTLAALANVALARHDYISADILARRSLELEPSRGDAWSALAASYAGLGWFEDASTCQTRAEELEQPAHAELILGRAVNQWGMTKTPAVVVGALMFFLVGLLAVAIAVTLPLVARELRMSMVPERFAAAAEYAWRFQTRPRVLRCAAVITIISAWTAMLVLA